MANLPLLTIICTCMAIALSLMDPQLLESDQLETVPSMPDQLLNTVQQITAALPPGTPNSKYLCPGNPGRIVNLQGVGKSTPCLIHTPTSDLTTHSDSVHTDKLNEFLTTQWADIPETHQFFRTASEFASGQTYSATFHLGNHVASYGIIIALAMKIDDTVSMAVIKSIASTGTVDILDEIQAYHCWKCIKHLFVYECCRDQVLQPHSFTSAELNQIMDTVYGLAVLNIKKTFATPVHKLNSLSQSETSSLTSQSLTENHIWDQIVEKIWANQQLLQSWVNLTQVISSFNQHTQLATFNQVPESKLAVLLAKLGVPVEIKKENISQESDFNAFTITHNSQYSNLTNTTIEDISLTILVIRPEAKLHSYQIGWFTLKAQVVLSNVMNTVIYCTPLLSSSCLHNATAAADTTITTSLEAYFLLKAAEYLSSNLPSPLKATTSPMTADLITLQLPQGANDATAASTSLSASFGPAEVIAVAEAVKSVHDAVKKTFGNVDIDTLKQTITTLRFDEFAQSTSTGYFHDLSQSQTLQITKKILTTYGLPAELVAKFDLFVDVLEFGSSGNKIDNFMSFTTKTSQYVVLQMFVIGPNAQNKYEYIYAVTSATMLISDDLYIYEHHRERFGGISSSTDTRIEKKPHQLTLEDIDKISTFILGELMKAMEAVVTSPFPKPLSFNADWLPTLPKIDAKETTTSKAWLASSGSVANSANSTNTTSGSTSEYSSLQAPASEINEHSNSQPTPTLIIILVASVVAIAVTVVGIVVLKRKRSQNRMGYSLI